ncbi:hypothetical protein [Massilia glaciei]|uniref:Uncharacterized protein n=1 Tax=Massilia glaciei TaxID=1524097 RepID=A0A2U2HIE9_9BURK|nr:hypothetical protein [Massilia glaciei]PWF46115.1 hypothetical protein C7C56_016490 [Massilia glaciei]
MAQLSATVRERAQLGEQDIAAMYALFVDYYGGTSAAMFKADLAGKTHAIVLHAEGKLCGFSTLTLIEPVPGAPGPVARTIFSGDTIIHHDHWGEQSLALTFCHFAGQVKAQQPQLPLYWFLISKGYRTYRYLHLFSKQYWPSHRGEAPPAFKQVLDALATKKFGEFYDPQSSVIRFPESRGHLRPDWAQVRDNLLERPEVRFFLERNPRFAEGEELACITLLDEPNLRSVARRAFVEGLGVEEARCEGAVDAA